MANKKSDGDTGGAGGGIAGGVVKDLLTRVGAGANRLTGRSAGRGVGRSAGRSAIGAADGAAGGSAGAIPVAEFVVAAVVLLLFEAFLLYNFFVSPQMAAAASARGELITKRAELERYRDDKKDSVGLAGQLRDLETRIAESETKLPPVLHNEDITIMVGQFSQEYNITVESVAFQERQLVAPEEYAPAAVNAQASSTASSTASQYAAAPANTQASSTASSTASSDAQTSSPVDSPVVKYGALIDEAPSSDKSLSLQGVQISFSSEFHTAGPFIKSFEDSERRVRVKSVTITRIQEGELKGVLNLEYAALSPAAEQGFPGLHPSVGLGDQASLKTSLFNKYNGFIEDNVDPTILLLSEEDDVDPDFYLLLKASTSNETKISYGVYPRVETELRSNVNNAIRAKLTISGDEEQFEYDYSLASYQKSEKRKLTAVGGKLRMKVLSCQRMGDDDNVAILLDVDNRTELPFEISVVNDDVLNGRFNLGVTKGDVNVVVK